MSSPPLLITFAIEEESALFFQKSNPALRISTILTGIGRRNAEKTIRKALAEQTPNVVLTCGFAGGLNPELPAGSVIFSADEDFHLSPALLASGARPAKFHCADRVVTTAEQKRALRESTSADAVEMESGVIRAICREHRIPSATVRVISDSANESLPLDFNLLMDAEQNLSYAKLAVALLKSPGKVGPLVRLQKQTKAAAEKLAEVLAKAISIPTQANS